MAKWGDVLSEMPWESVRVSPDFLQAQLTKQGVRVTVGIDFPEMMRPDVLDKYAVVLFVLDRAEFIAANKRIDEKTSAAPARVDSAEIG